MTSRILLLSRGQKEIIELALLLYTILLEVIQFWLWSKHKSNHISFHFAIGLSDYMLSENTFQFSISYIKLIGIANN